MEIHSTIKPASPQRIRGNLDTFTVIPPILATICSTGRRHVERGVGVEDVAGVERVASAERGLQRGIQISAHSQDAVDVRVMGAVRFPVSEPYRTTMVRSPPSWSAGMGFVEHVGGVEHLVHFVFVENPVENPMENPPSVGVERQVVHLVNVEHVVGAPAWASSRSWSSSAWSCTWSRSPRRGEGV